ncbi:MAG: GTPase Era [Anaerolineae bacterium]
MSDKERNENEESVALIEAFLQRTGRAEIEDESWFENVPPGHRSGFVAIIGRPNVGKSTLVNAFVGEKVAIVSRKPQTTRTRILGILTQPDYQVIFIDTPGIHKKHYARLNKLMVQHAVEAIPNADIILFLVDIAVPPRSEDRYTAHLLREKARQADIIPVFNKIDLVSPEQREAHAEQYQALLPEAQRPAHVSALHGQNVAALLERLVMALPQGPRYYPGDQVTDQTPFRIAAELIREALLRHTYEELPYVTAVLVEDFEERENGVTYISARIWVERETQKPILIGQGGSMLKRIGTEARKELERFVGGKVYLDLWVKPKPRWRDHDARLRELGYK